MIRPFGEAAFLVEVPDSASGQALARMLRERPPPGVLGAVPGLASVLVEANPLAEEFRGLPAVLERLVARCASDDPRPRKLHEILVRYGGRAGPDLEDVASLTSLPSDEVVRRHTAAELHVLFVGFAPGFAYLGGVDGSLAAVPRLRTPRTRVPRGSVAIADGMSGIYPADLPGGWRVIGRTETRLFDPLREPPSLLLPGDRVRFVAAAGDP